jgi:hypothetical protein
MAISIVDNSIQTPSDLVIHELRDSDDDAPIPFSS